MLMIAIPLWVIAALLVANLFSFVGSKQKEPTRKTKVAGVFVEHMSGESDVWTIEHPFGTDVMVQIIPDLPDSAGASFPYVEHLERSSGSIHIVFARRVSNFTAVILGEEIT